MATEGDGGNPMDEVAGIFTSKTLKELVYRLEAENKELKVNNSILHTQYTSQCETQSDILRTLHTNLDEQYTKIEEQENRIQKLEQQLEDQKQEAKDELEAQKAVWEARIAELQLKKEQLESELQKVEEFRKNKADLDAELARLKQQLQQQAEDHTRDVSAFDRKKAIEIDQLKKDMNRSIKETREVLKNRTKDQLDTTTKRTIMENEQMATELHFQSKETERLLDRNQTLLEENAQLRRNLLIHKDLENELARRTHVYQKLIKKMHGGRQKQVDVTGAPTERSRELHIEDPFEDTRQKKDSQEASRELDSEVTEENERLKRQNQGIQSTLQMVRTEFAQYRRDHATLTQLQDQSTRLIIATLYELKNQRECDPFPPATYDEHANWQFTNMTVRQKEYFFRVLLEKLNSSMCGSCFPCGPQPSGSNASLPSLVKDGSQANTGGASAAHFSQFLWSVATHGAQPHSHGASKKEALSKGVQTETDPMDPCFKEGMWSLQSRIRHSDAPSVTPAMVTNNVRSWGARAPGSTKQQRRSITASGSGRAV